MKEWSAYLPATTDADMARRLASERGYVTTHDLTCNGCRARHNTDAYTLDGVSMVDMGEVVIARCEHCLSERATVTNEYSLTARAANGCD